ncbi:MAG TPA: alpha/beta fold hydrolase [Thermoanaerobaculaceae bacterium]|nr:alpha/beta fold hydrolase [Thermoanaerobaculaceae bacterium]
MILERDGVALHVVVEGEGDPVVLLHGHAMDLRVWDEVVPPLVRAGLRVVRYDQRGHGRSGSPASGYRWGDHAADLAEVIVRSAGPAAHVVGLSKGAGIALECALRRPELVRSLGLVGPLVPDRSLSEAMRASFREVAHAIRTRGVQPAMREVWLRHQLIERATARPGARERLEAMVLAFPAGEYLAATRDVPDREWKVVDRLAEIAVPALVVRGDGEVTEFAAMAEELAGSVRRADSAVVRDSGHLVPLEQPAALAAVVVEFLGRVQRADGRA